LALQQAWSYTTLGQLFSSPALSDLNGDGKQEVVAMSLAGDYGACKDSNGATGNYVYALDAATGNLIWRTTLSDVFSVKRCASASATVADIDGDGIPEILFSIGWEIGILKSNGTQYTAAATTDNVKPTYYGYCTMSGSASVGDLRGDGQLEIVGGGSDCGSPSNGSLKVWDANPAANARSVVWPMFRFNATRTGSTIVTDVTPKPYKAYLALVTK
jgi:hypothetical protein